MNAFFTIKLQTYRFTYVSICQHSLRSMTMNWVTKWRQSGEEKMSFIFAVPNIDSVLWLLICASAI